MTSRDPEVVSVTESDIPADNQKFTPKESRLIPESVTVRAQDVGVIDTEVDEFTLEGDTEFEKSSQMLVTEKGEIMVSKETKKVSVGDTQQTKDSEVVDEKVKLRKSDSETSEDWEMVEVGTDIPKDVTGRTSEDDEAKEASKSKESVQDIVTAIDETLKDTEDLKAKASSSSDEDLNDIVVVESPEEITQREKSTDDITLKSQSDLDRVVTIDEPYAEQICSDTERGKNEIHEVLRPVDEKPDEPEITERYFTEDWIPDVITTGPTDKQTEKEIVQIGGEEQLKDDVCKTEEKEVGEIPEEQEPIETKLGEQSQFIREVAVELKDIGLPGDDEITIQEDKLDEIKDLPEQEKLRDQKRESPDDTLESKKEPDTVDGKNIKEAETKDKWSPDPIKMGMKERSTVRDERLDDLDDEFKDKDYFREEWSPDTIKTRVDKDAADKELISGSNEEGQSEETERREEFLYIEKHEQISRVFPGTKVSLIEVAEQGLIGAEETIEPESPDDKDNGSFREDWSPDVIDITKENTDESKEKESPSDDEAHLFEETTPAADIPVPISETPEVRETDVGEKQVEVKQRGAEEHAREDEIYEEYIHEDWTPDVIPQKTAEEKKPSPDKEPTEQGKESEMPEKLPSEMESAEQYVSGDKNVLKEQVVSEYTAEGEIYEEYMDEDWTPDVIDLTKEDRVESKEKESLSDSDVDLFEDSAPGKDMPEMKQTDVVGTHIKVKEQVAEEQVRRDEIYEEYIHEDWTPDVIPQKADEEKEKPSPEKEPTEQAKKTKKPEKLASDEELTEQYISEGKKVFKEQVVGEYTTKDEIYEEYMDEDWTPDVIPQKPAKEEKAKPSPEKEPIEKSKESEKPEKLPLDRTPDEQYISEDKKAFKEPVVSEYTAEDEIYEEYMDEDWTPDVILQGSGEDERVSLEQDAEKEEFGFDESKRQFREQIAGDYATEEGIYEDTLDDEWIPDVILKKPDVMDIDKPTSEEELEKIAKTTEPEKDEQETETQLEDAQELDTNEKERDENVVEDVSESEIVEPGPGELDTKAAREQAAGEYIAEDDIYEEYMAEDWSPDTIPDKLAEGDLERPRAEGAASKPDVTTAETDMAKYEKTDTFAQDIKYLPDGTTVILEQTHEDISKVILDDRDTVTIVGEESKTTDHVDVVEEGGEEQEPKKEKRKRKRRRKKNIEPIELVGEGVEEAKEEKQKFGEQIPGEYTAEGALGKYEQGDWKPDVTPQKPTDEDKEKIVSEAPTQVETPKTETDETPKPVTAGEPKSPKPVVPEEPEDDTRKEPESPKLDGDEPDTGLEDRVTEVVQPTEFDKSETYEEYSEDVIPHKPDYGDEEGDQFLREDNRVSPVKPTTDEQRQMEDKEPLKTGELPADIGRDEVEKEYLIDKDAFDSDIYDNYVREDWSPDTILQKPDHEEFDTKLQVADVDKLTEDQKETTYILKLRTDRDIEDIEEERSEERSRPSSGSEFLELEGEDEEYFREQWSPDVIKTTAKEIEKKEVEQTSESDDGLFEDAAPEGDEIGAEPKGEDEDVTKTTETEQKEEITFEEKHDRISKVFPAEEVTAVEVAEVDLPENEKTEELEETADDSFREAWSPDVINMKTDAKEDLLEEESKEIKTVVESSAEDSFKETQPGEAVDDKQESDKEDEPKGSVDVHETVEDTKLSSLDDAEAIDRNRFLGDVPSIDNIQLFEYSPKPEKLIFHLDKPRADVQTPTRKDRSVSESELDTIFEVAEQDLAEGEARREELEEIADDSFREAWSPDIIKVKTDAKEDLLEEESKEIKVEVESSEEDSFKETEISKEYPVEKTTVVEVAEQDLPEDEELEETDDDSFREAWSPDIIQVKTDVGSDQDKFYEEYHREWSHDIIMPEEKESTPESDADFFEDSTVTGTSEYREEMSTAFPDEKTALIMAAEEQMVRDVKKAVTVDKEHLLPRKPERKPYEIVASEVEKDGPYEGYFREEWSPDTIKVGMDKVEGTSVERKEEDVTICKELSKDTRETTVVDVMTVETRTDGVDVNIISERDTQESGYFVSLSIEPSVENIQIYEESPEPEKLVFNLDRTDVHIKSIERITPKVDQPGIEPSVSDDKKMDIDTKVEVDSTEEDVRVELKDGGAEPIEKPPTPRGAVLVDVLAGELEKESGKKDTPTGQLDTDITVEDITIKETSEKDIARPTVDTDSKTEDLTLAEIKEKAQVDDTVTDVVLEDVEEVSKEKDDNKYKASDSLIFSAPEESPRESVVISVPSDRTDLGQLAKEENPGAGRAEIDIDESEFEKMADEEETIHTPTDDTTSTMAFQETDEMELVTGTVETVTLTEDDTFLTTSDEVKPTGKIQTDVTVEEIQFGVVPQELEGIDKTGEVTTIDDTSVTIPSKVVTGTMVFETQTQDITLTHVTERDEVPDSEVERIAVEFEGVKTDVKLVEKETDKPNATISAEVDVKTDDIAFTDISEELKMSTGTVQDESLPDSIDMTLKPKDQEAYAVESEHVTTDIQLEGQKDVDDTATEELVTGVKLEEVDVHDEGGELSPDETETENVKFEMTDKYVQDVKYLPDGTTIVVEEKYEDISKVFISEEDTLIVAAEQDQITEGEKDEKLDINEDIKEKEKLYAKRQELEGTTEEQPESIEQSKEKAQVESFESDDEHAFRDAEQDKDQEGDVQIPKYRVPTDDTEKLGTETEEKGKVSIKDGEVDEAHIKVLPEYAREEDQDIFKDTEGVGEELTVSPPPKESLLEDEITELEPSKEADIKLRPEDIPREEEEREEEETEKTDSVQAKKKEKLPKDVSVKETDEADLPEQQIEGVVDIEAQAEEEFPSDQITVVRPIPIDTVMDENKFTGKLIMRGQYQVEEHPLDVTLPVTMSDADEAVTSVDEQEHKEEVELKGGERYVGKLNIEVPITDAIFDKEVPSPIPVRIEPHTEDIHLHSPEEPSSGEKVDEVTDKDIVAEDLFKATEPAIQEVATHRVVDQLPADQLKDADLTTEKEIRQLSKVDKEHLKVKAEEPGSKDLEKPDEDQDTVKELPKETIEIVQDEQLDEEYKDAAKTFAKEAQVDVQDGKPGIRDKEGETVSIIESKQHVLSKGDIVHDKESDIESEAKDQSHEQKADKSLEPSSEEEVFEEAEGGIREEKEAIVPVDEMKDDNLGKLSLDLEEITIPKEKEISDTSDDDQFKHAVPGKSIDEHDAEYSDQELGIGEEYTGEDILEGLSEEISETDESHVEKDDILSPEKEKTDAVPTVTDEYSGANILEKPEQVSETKTPQVTKLDETKEAAYPEEKIDIVPAVLEDKKIDTVTTIAPSSVESATEDITVSAKLILRGQYQVEEHPNDVQLPVSREDTAIGLIGVEELREDVEFAGEKHVGTFSVIVPVTDATFDKVVQPPITVHSEANVEDITLHVPKEIDEGKSEPTAAEIDTVDQEHMLPKDHEDTFEDGEGGRVEVTDENKVPKETEGKEVHAEKDQDKINEVSKEKLEGDEYRLDVTSTDISKEIELKEDETTGRETEISEDVEVAVYSPEDKVTEPSAPELEELSAEEAERAEVDYIEKVVEPSAPPLEEEADISPVLTTTEDIEEV